MLDVRVLESYLKLESRDFEFFVKAFNKKSKYKRQYSFMPFKQFPFIKQPDGRYTCISTDLLIEKLNAGIYWKIVDTFPKDQVGEFMQIFGFLFEVYVASLLDDVYNSPRFPARTRYRRLVGPTYVNRDKSADELIYDSERKHLIIVETKSSFLHADHKYGKNIQNFYQEIEKKFVLKDGKTGKGIGQLANHIVKLFHKVPDERASLADAEFNDLIHMTEKISPILIAQEPIVSFSHD